MSWNDFYRKTGTNPPNQILLKALSIIESRYKKSDPLFAIDLGCGSGNDSVELIRRGWNVLAIDKEEESINHLRSKLTDFSKLQTKVVCFEDMELPQSNFIYSRLSLPFCTFRSFQHVWKNIVDSLETGGFFAGTFLGENDDWADKVITLNEEDLKIMFKGFHVEFMRGAERHQKTPEGNRKKWHFYDIIASKH